MRSACRDQTSLIGFAPWYGGLAEGRSGLGRSVNGIAVYDSTAWHRMSRPQDAATAGGALRVWSGSRKPSSGLSDRLEIPVFTCSRVRSKMATPVVSLPVPAVVGIAKSGLTGPGTGSPFPIGLLT